MPDSSGLWLFVVPVVVLCVTPGFESSERDVVGSVDLGLAAAVSGSGRK